MASKFGTAPTNSRVKAALALCMALVCFSGISGAAQATPPSYHDKPHCVLLIVDTWHDPYATLVQSGRDRFQPVAALLKSWAIPFDILRLDQQHIDSSYLLNRAENARYSTIIWLADSASYSDQDLDSVEQAINAGTGLIALNSRVLDPVLDRMLGVQFKSLYTSTDTFRLIGAHFIVRGLSGTNMPSQNWEYSVRLWVPPQAHRSSLRRADILY